MKKKENRYYRLAVQGKWLAVSTYVWTDPSIKTVDFPVPDLLTGGNVSGAFPLHPG